MILLHVWEHVFAITRMAVFKWQIERSGALWRNKGKGSRTVVGLLPVLKG